MLAKVMIIFKSLPILICCMFIGQILQAQPDWEIDMQENGITVYTRYEENSAFKAFKATITVKATIDEILSILRKAEDYIEWYGYTRTSKVLKQEKNVQYNYVETIFPWPYSNRDMVYKMTIDKSDPEEVIISLDGLPDYLPVKEGLVRMEKASGIIQLKTFNDYTKLTYQFHSEPGKNLPIWLANTSIAELPYKTLLGLKNVVEN